MRTQVFLMLAVIIALAIANPTEAAAKPRPVFEVVKLEREIEHSMDGGRIDYKSKAFTENFQVEGGVLHSYTVHVQSKRNVKDLEVDKDKHGLTIKGRVYREAAFGAGGKYKAKVAAIFLRPVLAVDPDDFELDLLKFTAVSSDSKTIRDTKSAIIESIRRIGRYRQP